MNIFRNICWPRTTIIVAVWSIVFWCVVMSAAFSRLIRAEGMTGGFVAGGYILFLLPIIILCSAITCALSVNQYRWRHFRIALVLAIMMHVPIVVIIQIYNRINNNAQTQRMYQDEPQTRPLLDPKRPVTIIRPGYNERITSPMTVSVYAMPDVLIDGPNIFIKSELRPGDGKVLAQAVLTQQKHESPDGRAVWTATLTFNPEKFKSGWLVVEGKNNYADIRPVTFE